MVTGIRGLPPSTSFFSYGITWSDWWFVLVLCGSERHIAKVLAKALMLRLCQCPVGKSHGNALHDLTAMSSFCVILMAWERRWCCNRNFRGSMVQDGCWLLLSAARAFGAQSQDLVNEDCLGPSLNGCQSASSGATPVYSRAGSSSSSNRIQKNLLDTFWPED